MRRTSPSSLAGLAGQLQEFEEAGMHGGLAAGEVDDVQLAPMVPAQMGEGLLEILDVHVEGVGILVVDVADRAIQVARAGDGDDGQPDLLRMAAARAAIEGATVLDLLLDDAGRGALRLEGARVLVPFGVVGKADFLPAMLLAILAHPHLAVP
jgi:hypothetical protein